MKIFYFFHSRKSFPIRDHEPTVAIMRKAELSKKCIKGIYGVSPFVELPFFDIIWSFTFDLMHTVCLGNMKHMISLWLSEPAKYFNCDNPVDSINDFFKNLQVPSYINRKPSNIQEYVGWKATQLRDFLIFYGPVCLRSLLNAKYYENFMLLSNAIFTFMKQEIAKNDFDSATLKIYNFLTSFEILYGIENMRFNIHLLSHLPIYVLYSGPLWTCSLFAYENMNRFCNMYIQGTNNVIQEAAVKISIYQNKFLGFRSKRISKYAFNEGATTKIRPRIATEIDGINYGDYFTGKIFQIKNFVYKNNFFHISTNNKNSDSFVCLSDGTVGKIVKVLINDNNIFVALKVSRVDFFSDHIMFLENREEPVLVFSSINSISSKIFFMESSKCFIKTPNNFEFNTTM